MMDTTQTGAKALIDPETADELRADALPAFILSTDGEAGDGNRVRQHWDLSRADTVGIPVIWSHDPKGADSSALLGQWTGLGVRDVNGARVLVGRPNLDMENPAGAMLMGQIRRGFCRGVSVGWRPGKCDRRGALDPEDPMYLPPEDDECGYPAEGVVMGTPEEPNCLYEASPCAVPSDPAAFVTERQYAAAERVATSLLRGSPVDAVRTASPLDLDALLVYLREHRGAQAWLRREIDEAVARRSDRHEPSPIARPMTAGEFLDSITRSK